MMNSLKKEREFKKQIGNTERNEIKHQVIVFYFTDVKIAVVRWSSLRTGIPGICNRGFAFVGRMMMD